MYVRLDFDRIGPLEEKIAPPFVKLIFGSHYSMLCRREKLLLPTGKYNWLLDGHTVTKRQNMSLTHVPRN